LNRWKKKQTKWAKTTIYHYMLILVTNSRRLNMLESKISMNTNFCCFTGKRLDLTGLIAELYERIWLVSGIKRNLCILEFLSFDEWFRIIRLCQRELLINLWEQLLVSLSTLKELFLLLIKYSFFCSFEKVRELQWN